MLKAPLSMITDGSAVEGWSDALSVVLEQQAAEDDAEEEDDGGDDDEGTSVFHRLLAAKASQQPGNASTSTSAPNDLDLLDVDEAAELDVLNVPIAEARRAMIEYLLAPVIAQQEVLRHKVSFIISMLL